MHGAAVLVKGKYSVLVSLIIFLLFPMAGRSEPTGHRSLPDLTPYKMSRYARGGPIKFIRIKDKLISLVLSSEVAGIQYASAQGARQSVHGPTTDPYD